MAGVRKVARGHSRQVGETILFTFSFVHFQVPGFSSFADNTIRPSVYQQKWSGLMSRTGCPLQFAVT